MRLVRNLFLFCTVVVFLVLTLPANHNEAEDAYHYSSMAERGAWSQLFHAHHLLYHPLMRSVYRATQAVGYTGRSMPVLIGVSIVCGAWAIGLFCAILRRLGAGRSTALAFSAGLLFSYGFWRYSTTVEIYIPVSAVSLLAFYCVLRSRESRWYWAGGVVASALALLLHLVAIPVAVMAIPLFYWLNRMRAPAMLHLLAVTMLVAAVYLIVHTAGIEPGVYRDTLVPRGILTEPLTWLKATVALGQTLVSGNFLFSIPRIAEALVQLFPYHMLQEELFAGQQAQPWIGGIASLTFILSLGVGVLCAILFVRAGWVDPKRFWRTVWSPGTVAALVWAGGIGGMALIHEPANPEMWISIVPALWLSLALLWSGAGPRQCRVMRLPHLLALLLLLHNGIGGMAVVRSPRGDYCLHKGGWIREEAGEGDVIVTADSHIFVTWLQYYTPATVLDAKFVDLEQLLDAIDASDGRVFVFDDVIDLLPPVARRDKDCLERIGRLGAYLHHELTPLHESPSHILYRYVPAK